LDLPELDADSFREHRQEQIQCLPEGLAAMLLDRQQELTCPAHQAPPCFRGANSRFRKKLV